MSEHRHHLPVITVERHDGKIKVCPHCQQEVTEKSIYRDKKGWLFHRPCFAKGKGSIGMDKESGILVPGTLGAVVGGAIGASGKVPHVNTLRGALIGGGLGLAAGSLMPGQLTDPLTMLTPERRQELEARFKKITNTLDRSGTDVNTHHKRVIVPHDFFNENDMRDYGFRPSYTAIPELGQSEFRTWRHPSDLHHFHRHPQGFTVHKDQAHPGVKHLVTEGLPAYGMYLKRRLAAFKESGQPSMAQDILNENPEAIVKSGSAPVIHEKQDNDYNCGPAALKAVENSMGIGHTNQQAYEKETNTSEANGTPIVNLEQTAENHGHDVDSGEMSLEQLKQHVAVGTPVIVAVQLDGPEGGPSDGWESGHYVVITGIDDNSVSFMDPNSDTPERSWSLQKFLSRWHDHDYRGNVYNNWGMALAKQAAEVEKEDEKPSWWRQMGYAGLAPAGLLSAAHVARTGLNRIIPSMSEHAHTMIQRPEFAAAVAHDPAQAAALQSAVKSRWNLMRMMSGRDVAGVNPEARKKLMDVVLGKPNAGPAVPTRQGDVLLHHAFGGEHGVGGLIRQTIAGVPYGHTAMVGPKDNIYDMYGLAGGRQYKVVEYPMRRWRSNDPHHQYMRIRPNISNTVAHAGGEDVVGKAYRSVLDPKTGLAPYGHRTNTEIHLAEGMPEFTLPSGRSVFTTLVDKIMGSDASRKLSKMLPSNFGGDFLRKWRIGMKCKPGETCTTLVHRGLEALKPGLLQKPEGIAAGPVDFQRGIGKQFEPVELNLPRAYRKPSHIYGEHFSKYGPLAVRALPIAALAGLGIYGGYKALSPMFKQKEEEPITPKLAADGELGSGGDQSQSSGQAQALDASGSAIAGRTDQQPANQELLNQLEQPPDPQVFDMSTVEKAAAPLWLMTPRLPN
jgi:predicted double-glycine peptidase